MTESLGSVTLRDRTMMRVPPARVNCTHTSMDMVYNKGDCDVCHSPSTFGWLYRCQQDQIQALPRSSSNSWKSCEDLNASILQEFVKLGFTRSILCQIAEGHYTVQQMNKLKQQKIHVTNTIASQRTMLDSEVHHGQESSAIIPINSNVTIRAKRGKTYDDRHAQMTAVPVLQVDMCCTLQCCHRCRPYYKDRVYASLNAIVGDADAANSPVFYGGGKLLDPRIVRRIGLQEQPKLSNPADSLTDPISASSSYFSLSASSHAAARNTADCTTDDSHCAAHTGDVPNTRVNGATKSSFATNASHISSALDSTAASATIRGGQTHSLVSRLLTMARSASQRPIMIDRTFTVPNLLRKSRTLSH